MYKPIFPLANAGKVNVLVLVLFGQDVLDGVHVVADHNEDNIVLLLEVLPEEMHGLDEVGPMQRFDAMTLLKRQMIGQPPMNSNKHH